jgi:ABC-type cobalamin/Fe3+-siderophores transport system ATPase subunit
MWFKQFKIKNYRSIINTGWQDLASDNITGLIGQNESGKTSILEALNSFYSGNISDDILRSDLSLPEVSCSFSISSSEIKKIFPDKKVPEKILAIVNSREQITLTRSWNADKSSYLSFGDEAVCRYYTELEEQMKEFRERTLEELHRIIKDARRAEEELEQIQVEREDIEKELNMLTPQLIRSKKILDRKPDQDTQNQVQKLVLETERLNKRLEKKTATVETKAAKAEELSHRSRYAQLCLEAQNQLSEAKLRWEDSYRELIDLQGYVENLETEKEMKGMQSKLDMLNSKHLENDLKLEKSSEKAEFSLAVTSRILKGADPSDAEDLAEKERNRNNGFYSESELADIAFSHIPVFELFEDFSSLLPNRIDLEDVFSLNATVEGYKAARNFLVVSGLKATFFEERNSRILKHKIEKLNNEITLNFQDYWRQSLGKTNKIKIHFELEHYDDSHPDKMGKPYLEFWIKDDQERLYPKQRSRGVRWFLSFYLELKANAIENKERSRIFLIDEPGLSLHARAQEDVLKVFEDIKEDIQIIYSTHSPHLINLNKLYRLLAVQRAIEDDMRSETVIFSPKSLNDASTDTLSPIYTLMGTKMSDHQFVKKKNNIIVEDTPTYYFLSTIFDLAGYPKELYFLPSTDVNNVPMLVNLLMGWRLDFIVLLDDDPEGNRVYQELRSNIYLNNDAIASRKLLRLDNLGSVEDLFSTIDFKNFVLHQRVGITEKNSEYIEMNDISRAKLASDFILHVQDTGVKFEDFDEETRDNIKQLIRKLDSYLI